MSRCLAGRSIDHVVLERGEVANAWKTQRWDSLRLLTPNWQTRLPGWRVAEGEDPEGFRSVAQTAGLLERYAASIGTPVLEDAGVTSMRRTDAGYVLATTRGEWRSRAVVLASGACNLPRVPALAQSLPAGVRSLTPHEYRNPEDVEAGGVLVVGASSTGVQLADELQRAGRSVTLAVGEHVRAPRNYRGRDIQWWMDAAGVLDQRYHELDDLERARRLPSFQLAGHPDGRAVDLNALTERGVRLAGRVAALRDGKALFSGSLANVTALADLKMNRLLDAIDEWAAGAGLGAALEPAQRFASTRLLGAPLLSLDLAREGIRTVLWATGYRPDYSWLHVPVLDAKGRVRHDGGVVAGAPGLYILGLPFLRRRKSALIDGAGDDARELSAHLADYLARLGRSASVMKMLYGSSAYSANGAQ